jgi:nicotinamide mononucleotide transporter
LFAALVFALGLGVLLMRKTNAMMPYLDSLITALGIAGTWLMMYQVHACWLYLLVVNLLSIFLFYSRRLYAATLMFVLYFILSIDGYFTMHWFEL